MEIIVMMMPGVDKFKFALKSLTLLSTVIVGPARHRHSSTTVQNAIYVSECNPLLSVELKLSGPPLYYVTTPAPSR
jgi:hypothetical protein